MRSGKTLQKRVAAALCVGLLVVFNLASASAAVNRMQHAPGAPEDHEHLMFSNLVMEDHHDDGVQVEHHDDGDHHEIVEGHDHDVAAQERHDHDVPADAASKTLAGDNHHHHHGDIGTSLVILAASAAGPIPLWDRDKQPGTDNVRISVRRSLLERPPRTSLISV